LHRPPSPTPQPPKMPDRRLSFRRHTSILAEFRPEKCSITTLYLPTPGIKCLRSRNPVVVRLHRCHELDPAS
jgi:hypothetical protein